MKEKFDPICLPNNCFSLVGELKDDDERRELFKKQRLERGFDDTELWNLDCTILKFTLPRLKAFKETTNCHPGDVTADEWQEILGKIITLIENILNGTPMISEEDEGFELLKKYFFSLWF